MLLYQDLHILFKGTLLFELLLILEIAYDDEVPVLSKFR